MAKQYAKTTAFVLVYIQEAHAYDEWRMGQPRDICQHKCLQDRQAAFGIAMEDLPELHEAIKAGVIDCYLDSMSFPCGNPAHGSRCGLQRNFERVYGAWPLRYLLFEKQQQVLSAPSITSDPAIPDEEAERQACHAGGEATDEVIKMRWKAMPKGDDIPLEDVVTALNSPV